MIDLRSDTVTRPTEAMREAMARADVGDDVYGEDPTVLRLEARVAEIFGKEASVFVASGTMSNLLGIISQCERGDEYLVAQGAHTYRYEGGGAAVLGSVQPQPIESAINGALDPERIVEEAKTTGDPHFARTRLLTLENAYWGRLQTLDEMNAATSAARASGLSTHLDGARVFNATVGLGIDPAELTRGFDTVSVCLSKGLGAPVGSVLAGPTDVIERARRWKKVVGGGWRQAGILAAAGLHALEHHVERLAEDHRRARTLADELAELAPLKVDRDAVETNMVFVEVAEPLRRSLEEHLEASEIRIGGRGNYRLVLHLGVDDDALQVVIDAFRSWARST